MPFPHVQYLLIYCLYEMPILSLLFYSMNCKHCDIVAKIRRTGLTNTVAPMGFFFKHFKNLDLYIAC